MRSPETQVIASLVSSPLYTMDSKEYISKEYILHSKESLPPLFHLDVGLL